MTEYWRGYAAGLDDAARWALEFVVAGEIDCTSDPRKALDLLAEYIDERSVRCRDFIDMRS